MQTGGIKHCNGSGAAVEFRSQIQVEEATFVSAVETAVSRDKAQATLHVIFWREFAYPNAERSPFNDSEQPPRCYHHSICNRNSAQSELIYYPTCCASALSLSRDITTSSTLCQVLSGTSSIMSDLSVSTDGGDIEAPPSRREKSRHIVAIRDPQSGPPQSSTGELAEGISRWIEAASSFFYVEIASVVLLFSCIANWFPWVYMKYALSVACVSLGICLILQTAEFLVPGFLERVVIKQREDGRGGHTIEKICSVFLLIWWLIGTGIITFRGELLVFGRGTAVDHVLNSCY